MRWFIVLLALTVGANAAGLRWLTATQEDIQIEGATYRVAWLRDAENIDVEIFRNEFFVLMPDPIVEKRRAIQAGTIVASRLCKGVVTQIVDTRDGDKYAFTFACKP